MLRKALTLYIGSKWRTFCGMSRVDFMSRATETLDELGYEYSIETTDTSGGEQLMLGSGEEGNRISVAAPDQFTVDVVTAKSNPLLGFGLKFFSTEEMREEMTSDACIVDINGIDDESRASVAALLTGVVELSDRPPWKLTHHVGFRLAVLLRLKVKLLWRYWLNIERTSGARTL